MSKKVKEMIGGCCVCSDERGWSENPLVYCDGAGCNVAVHQACYGIVQVPTGPWFCKKCESQERVARVKCELCPQRAGALKRTDAGGWCHVVCALYIPEAWFANVQTMEPIVLSAVPHERFNKKCYICEEQKRDTKATAGACMQCNRNSCKQFFHVTCAQAQGLLCEVTGSYENVKYCGYCSHHYKKLKNHSNVKTIPAFKPIPSENGTPDSSPEKSVPNKPEENKTVESPAIVEVKSPQVDQSVSSTSDTVPSSSSAPVPDSAVSPPSDHSQEPSSSGVVSTKSIPEGNACSSTESCDVADTAHVLEPAALPKRHRPVSLKCDKPSVKKSKASSITSTVPHRKEGPKKPSKKHRDPGNTMSPNTSTTSTLPGHHDYCGSIFGGSPYFQSLSAPGRVSLQQALFTSLPYDGDSYLYATDDWSDSGNVSSQLIPPPKQFPSLSCLLPKSDQPHFPLTMEQLLEQQWEQGAQFLMEQGQHFDVAALLNCLHRLKGDNQNLEDQVRELTSRRNHLMAVNARLSLPLSLYDSSNSSSVGSLEDISSPDDVQAPKLAPTVQIPSNSDLIVEDILSPVETESSSLSSNPLNAGYFPDQVCPPQPLMYSVVNPPPANLPAQQTALAESSQFPSLSGLTLSNCKQDTT
ncbi:protein AF-10-like isoform X2 [Physella acuta]|uniref:protein AF-10-like isoform X2 n=1 Tax=Physella acuta TaxID=109671 RepID=UPI0027DDA522|nr:protein AF-10-like isoform X2 [Physella acuta]